MMYSWSKSDRQLIRCVYALVFNIEDHIGFVVYKLLKAPFIIIIYDYKRLFTHVCKKTKTLMTNVFVCC